MNHKICAFFGHKDFDGDEVLLARLEEEIERLIIDKDA